MGASFLLADSFLPAVVNFSASEKARVLDFISQFQKNPANPGISLERVNGARADNVWSGRVSRDIRAILFKDGDTWVALHVDHHDPAYRWAERRDIGRHPVTGSLQVVEVVEDVREVLPEPARTAPRALLADHSDEYLLSLGTPESWLPVLREVADDDQLLDVCVKLPEDVAERLLRVAGGELVTPPAPVAPEQPITESPEVGHRFYVVEDESDIQSVLNAPLSRWIAFLHPTQRKIVEGTFKGPAKVTGSAGTGKTTVAMHRARHLARQGQRVLLTTFVTTLADNLLRQMKLFCTEDELSRIRVSTVHSRGLSVARKSDGRMTPANPDEIHRLLDRLRLRHAAKFDAGFVRAEWDAVIEPHGIQSWKEYRTARRTGRGRPLSVADRKVLWRVFESALADLASQHKYNWASICRTATARLEGGQSRSDFDAVLVDEVQDLKPPALTFLAALTRENPGGLMLFGDAGQRIYPGGFSLAALGIETRGRSHILRLNYRTTEQIRKAADRVLGIESDDLDGGTQTRTGTRSLLRGPEPVLKGYESREVEADEAARRVARWLEHGLSPNAIGIFSRTRRRARQILAALSAHDINAHELGDEGPTPDDDVQVGTMHRAKGLEFKAVLLCDCSAKTLPSPGALAAYEDPRDLAAAEDRERRLLYVAMTRARDELAITWVGTPSPFLTALLPDKEKKEA
ncbi:MAG: 3'-5' exonuclease [Myxococcota bacterium]|nr:3'-5' exonuclease [Myxococcota bacterium]